MRGRTAGWVRCRRRESHLAAGQVVPAFDTIIRYHRAMDLRLRLPDEIHSRLRIVAEEDGKSLNAEIVVAIEEYLQRKQTNTVRAIARKVAQRDAELLDRLSK